MRCPIFQFAGDGDDGYDPRMEERISRVEENISDMKWSVGRLEETTKELRDTTSRLDVAIVRVEAKLDATLPHLATKAEVAELRADMVAGFADKPSKTYMWGILAVLLTAYAGGLAGLAVLK
jgi:hypothetical protein